MKNILLLSIVALWNLNANAQCSPYSSGPKNPSSATQMGAIPSCNSNNPVGWTSITNIYLADGSYAYCSPTGTKRSYYLLAQGFSFSIPTTHRITGIQVDVKWYTSGTANQCGIKLFDNTLGLIGTDHSTGASIPASNLYSSFGGQFDMWGTTLTPTDINKSTFGIAVGVNASNNVYIDHIRMTIFVDPRPYLTNPIITNVTCNGGSDGSASVTASGGVSPYTFSWNTIPIQTTATAINLSAGNYTVTVTDSNSCTNSTPTTITEPSPIFATITPNDSTTFCLGDSVTLNSSAGSSYLWSTGAVTQSINVTTIGNYSVTITDGNGCSATSLPTNVSIDSSCSNCLIGVSKNITNNLCYGDTNGIIDITPLQSTPNIALSFDGIDDYINTGLDSISNNEITIEYWFKGSSIQSTVRQQGGGQYIISGWNDLHVLSNDGGTGAGINIGSNAEDGNWHHIAMTWKQNTSNGFKSYLDGVLIDQRNSNNSILPIISNSVLIGSLNGVGEFTNGFIDEVRIWSVSLDSSTIYNNYSACGGISTSHPNYPNLRLYYKMNEGLGTTVVDKSGNSNSGLLINGVSWSNPNDVTYGCYTEGIGYSYSWSNGSVTEDIINLTANTYMVTIIDGNGCTVKDTSIITEPAQLTGIDTRTECNSYTWIDGNTYSTNTNTPTFTLINTVGCDSMVTLNLTINTIDTSITQNINTLTVGELGATYQWLDCNNGNAVIVGDTNQSYIPATSGNYAVVVSKNGCTDTSACVNFIITGISDIENTFVKIYPNPTTAEFVIELSNNSVGTPQLSIVSVEGKTVYTNNSINTNKIVVNAANWSKGIYVVKITDEKSTQVIKLVKE